MQFYKEIVTNLDYKIFMKIKYYAFSTVSIIGVALIITAPNLFYGYPHGHSALFNVPWLHFFLGQLSEGKLYPRWLTDYPPGMGSPVFYFYGPAPFYLGSILSPICRHCSTAELLNALQIAIFVLSGLTFYAWSLRFAGPWIRIAASVIYMILPYHYIDLEVRNAIGESLAYAFLPLIFLALDRMSGTIRAIPLAVLGYAGLIYSHLPSALLLIPFMAIFVAVNAPLRDLWQQFLKLACVGIGGVMVAAPYFVPALELRGDLVANAWKHSSQFLPENWLLPGGLQFKDFALDVYSALSLATGLAGLAGAMMFAFRYAAADSSHTTNPARQRILIVALLSLSGAWLLMSDATRWLWINFDFLQNIQFPWRLGTVVDFWVASALCVALAEISDITRSNEQHRINIKLLALCTVLLLVPGLSLMSIAWNHRSMFIEKTWSDAQPESCCLPPVEYRLKWALDGTVYKEALASDSNAARPYDKAYRHLSDYVAALPPVSIARHAAADETVAIERIGPTEYHIEANLDRPARMTVRQGYFPSWRLTDDATGRTVPLSPSPETGLIEADLPAGRQRLRLTIAPLPEQQLGAILCIAAVAVCGFFLAWPRLRPFWRVHQSIARG